MFKKWRMLAKSKHHIWKEHGLKLWDMAFPGDSSIFSRKIVTMKIRQDLGHFSTKRVKPNEILKKNLKF